MLCTLKQIRQFRGLSQKEAAEKLGISTDCLGNYEREKTYPDVPVIRKMEKLYDVTFDKLIFLSLDYDKIVN